MKRDRVLAILALCRTAAERLRGIGAGSASGTPLDAVPPEAPIASAPTVTPRPTTEAEVVARLVEHIDQLFGSVGSFHVATEVRTHGRSRADVLVFAGEELVAIEAKLLDWRRALGQAALNQSVADMSYVAMWAGRTPPSLLEQAAAEGVGVIAVSADGLTVLLSASRGRPDSTARCASLARLHEAVKVREGRA